MSLEEILKFTATAIGGGGVMHLLNWLNNRDRVRAYVMGAVDKSVDVAMKSVTTQLERTDERLERTDGRLEVVEKQHEECERTLIEVRFELSKRDTEINRLMAGRIASYGEKPSEGH